MSSTPPFYQKLSLNLISVAILSMALYYGRTVGAVGIPTQPNVFYMGVNNGGVWKTDDFGRTWKPIFDNKRKELVVHLQRKR